jgi:hypothetical protein
MDKMILVKFCTKCPNVDEVIITYDTFSESECSSTFLTAQANKISVQVAAEYEYLLTKEIDELEQDYEERVDDFYWNTLTSWELLS